MGTCGSSQLPQGNTTLGEREVEWQRQRERETGSPGQKQQGETLIQYQSADKDAENVEDVNKHICRSEDAEDVQASAETEPVNTSQPQTTEAEGKPAQSKMEKTGTRANMSRRLSKIKKGHGTDKSQPDGRPKTSHRRRTHATQDVTTSATEDVFRGDVMVDCPSTAKIVRIFTSSTFTDTRHERNALMERVYPALKELCQQHGYEFQVVDMRWGVRDEATDDHMGTELCLREVDLCRKLSTGPSFVTFLSHKYGYGDLPNKIEAKEYEQLCGVMKEESQSLLNTWYRRDDNAVPPTYVLQPISSILPEYLSVDEEKRKSARVTWQEQSNEMHGALASAAKQELDETHAHKYKMSVTEAEITRGTEGNTHNCLWFQRVIEDIDQQEPSYLLSRYKECRGPEETVHESQALLALLRDKKLPELLDSDNRKTYSITWTENGVDPVNCQSHELYIRSLCHDFQEKITLHFQEAIEARKKTDLANPLYAEVVEHTLFCQAKCQAFHGRQDTLSLIRQYLEGESRSPFTVHGPSGCGKTSIVAMAAKEALEVFHKKAATVIRFIGTTPDSSTIGALLASVTSQIWRIYENEADLPVNIQELSEVFHESLKLASDAQPLVILLDSLDQFDPSGGARKLDWLPQELPAHVKIVLSTLPEAQYESLPRLKELCKSEDSFLDVPTLADNDVNGILNKCLDIGKRTLTDTQRNVVLKAFQECPLPLFLKLSFDEASRWPSFAPPTQTVLETSVRGSINALFSRIEDMHGKIFVSNALAYLTLSKSGLTESELEDILSCDDDVLNDVYMYWTPPIRRLPPLLLVRLKTELGQYLVDRGADGVRVFFWYHRQFIEAATDRYCSNKDTVKKMHAALADYFAGTWAHGKSKPYVDKNGVESTADRMVALQPLQFQNGFNLRKLNNLPYHRLEAGQIDLLKEEGLFNFSFLYAKLRASGLRPILDDFEDARTSEPDDNPLKSVGECLQLSQDALASYPQELPSQLLGRIRNTNQLQDLLQGCRQSPDCFLLPDKPILTPPGGQLVHCLADHKGDLQGIDMTEDFKFAITCATDRSVKIWDVDRGRQLRSIDNVGENPLGIHLCCKYSVILVNADDYIVAIKFDSGVILYTLRVEDSTMVSLGGKDKNILGVFHKQSVTLYQAATGKRLRNVICDYLDEDRTFMSYMRCPGSERYMAVTDSDQFRVYIFDLESNTFIHDVDIFYKFTDDDGVRGMYTVDAFVFSRSGHLAYIANIYTNDIHIYDTATMEVQKVLKGKEMDILNGFRTTFDEKKLYFPNNNELVVWDLEAGERTVAMTQSMKMTDVVMKDTTRAVTISDDRVIRIWDLTREPDEPDNDDDDIFKQVDEESDEKDDSTEVLDKNVKAPELMLRDLKLLPNPRYIVLECHRAPHDYIQVYDLCLSLVVRNIQLDAYPWVTLVLSDNQHLLVGYMNKLKTLDLMSGKVLRTFQGRIRMSRERTDIAFIKGKQGFAVLSRGRMRIKLYDTTSGLVSTIMKADNTEMFDAIKSNESGSIVLAGVEDGPCYVFDATKGVSLYVISKERVSISDNIYVEDALLTSDDAYLVFSGFKDRDTRPNNSQDILFSWDIQNNRLHKELADEECDKRYEASDKIENTGLDTYVLLDDRTVLANHNDSYIRIYDIITGELKKRLEGHEVGDLHTSTSGKFFVSQGIYSKDMVFKVTDKVTGQTVATFSPDYNVRKITQTEDGYHIVGVFDEYRKPVLWTLHGGIPEMTSFKPLSSYANIYGTEVVQMKVKLIQVENNAEDPTDPDTDISEFEDDYNDDDDKEVYVDKEQDDEMGEHEKEKENNSR